MFMAKPFVNDSSSKLILLRSELNGISFQKNLGFPISTLIKPFSSDSALSIPATVSIETSFFGEDANRRPATQRAAFPQASASVPSEL